MFLQFNRLQEFTAFLVECMTQNRPEDGVLQSKALEMNLVSAPQVADAILQMKQWTQFNRERIAHLCEQKGLYMHALENYSDPKDVRRVVLNTHSIDLKWLAKYLGRIDPQLAMLCMSDLLKATRSSVQAPQIHQFLVSVAIENNQRFTVPAIIKMFESVSSYEGVYMFLAAIVGNTQDKDIYHKYIEAAAKCNQIKVLEAIITEKKDCYDPEYVKNFLKE